MSEWHLLIVDQHGSHVTLEFLILAQDYKIVILALPPHSTHKLQPLDVGLFAPIAQYYGQELMKCLKGR